jgi:hypothetical protein
MTDMRLHITPILGLIEVGLAVVLFLLGLALPARDDVRRGFDGARRATSAAGGQVQSLRDQVAELRRSRLRQSADRLGVATRTISTALRATRLDFDSVRTIRDVTGRAAEGLDGIAGALDPGVLEGLGNGLGATADYLDREVVPAATRAADGLDASSGRLQAGVRQFARLVRQSPPDLKPLREVHDGLARFDEGLGSLQATLDPRRLAALRQAIEGAEGVVDEAARLAERAAGYSYPVVTLDGLKPRVSSRPFWPRGAEVGADMRKVAGGVIALEKEIGALADELPRIQVAVAEGRKSIAATRTTLAGALGRQTEVERLLAEMPEQAARLAEELPRLTGELSRAIRGAERLREVAVALRRTRTGLDLAQAKWPAVREGIAGSAALIRASRDQMDQALEHRREYEAAWAQIEGLAGDFAELLPALTEGLDTRLDREDRTLAEMAGGLEQASRALPAYAEAIGRCSAIGRLLAWLVATITGLHGSALLLGGIVRLPRTPASGPEAARTGLLADPDLEVKS